MTTRKQSVRKSVRLWGWRDSVDRVWFRHGQRDAKEECEYWRGTYLGEYIARPVKAKKKGKKNGKAK